MAKYFSVKASSEKIRIDFYGDIVADAFWKWTDDDKCPSEIADALKNNPGATIEMHINSGGGDAFAGLAIYNILKTHAGRKVVYVDGLAASSASVIAMAGDEINIPKTAHLMVHKPWTSAWGANADDMRKAADMLDAVETSMMAAYMTRAVDGVDEEAIKALVAAETWMTGEKAAQYFKVTVTELSAAACTSDVLARYTNTPPELKAPPTPPPANDPPASDAMNVGDELAIVSSYIFSQREELDNE
ncbi:MAG TPA: head maturation protease, ClpP-related [Clostridia bacterium]|nr:head maturation protease, ClpP-related [Clostridia bacterium]